MKIDHEILLQKGDYIVQRCAPDRTNRRFRIFEHLDRVEESWETDNVSCQFPLSLEIHPTDICNIACRFCAYADIREGDTLSKEVFSNLISEIISEGKTASVAFAGGGEPTCNPYLPEAIERLSDAGIQVGIITNAVFSSERILKALLKCTWIRVSVNAADEESYVALNSSSVHDFRKVWHNLKAISEKRSPSYLKLGVSMIVHQDYEALPYLKKFIDLAKEVGADYAMYRPLKGNEELETVTAEKTFREWQEEIEAKSEKENVIVNYCVFLREKFNLNWQNKLYSKCPLVYDGMIAVVAGNGDIYSCIPKYVDGGGDRTPFGNLYNQSFKEIWNGQRRAEIVRGIDAKDCPRCRHHNMNEMLLKYLHGEIDRQECSDPHWKFL
jgi:radical SAM protein with 4Fe4S-binding SPASM domain